MCISFMEEVLECGIDMSQVCVNFQKFLRKPYLGNSSPPPNLLSFELWEIALKFSDSQMGSFEPLVSFLGKIYFHGLHYGK